MEQWTIILLAAVAVVVAVVVTALVVREKDRKKVAYMLDAFEDGELNFRFTENSAFNSKRLGVDVEKTLCGVSLPWVTKVGPLLQK